MVIKPYADKIIIRKIEEQYQGVIHIPDSARKMPPVEGVVVAHGPDVDFVKAGDRIVYGKYAALDLKEKDYVGECDLAVILEADIIYKKEGDAICQTNS